MYVAYVKDSAQLRFLAETMIVGLISEMQKMLVFIIESRTGIKWTDSQKHWLEEITGMLANWSMQTSLLVLLGYESGGTLSTIY